MWPWKKSKLRSAETFLSDLQNVESDCIRRLDFVDAHLRRAARKHGPWQSAMTVADVDIAPMGRATQVVTAVQGMSTNQKRVATAGLVLAVIILITVVAFCAATPLEMP
ncbi:MAG: hypothetical protein A2289_08585 [Deltaproteobacteria bacterium RIFOXYA12_FULL_58_15]|nr:MAG: hypothetical protein A2289_08585 [Deltaproteobacteria bacterium RIFOXYA12_FULL_58_15]